MKDRTTAREMAERADRLHREAVVVDTVNRSVLDDRFLADLRAGGVSVLGRTILVSSADVFSPFGFDESLREISHLLTFIDQHPNELLLVKNANDMAAARDSGRTGIYIYFQSPEPLDRQPWRLRMFYELGLRVLQLTYNERCLVGDGCAEASDAGLSEYGRRLIDDCNRVGIALDVSHCGDRTTLEAIDASSTPVLITHGMSRVLCDNPRCKTDEAVKRCAEAGGVIGIQALPAFISADPDPTFEQMLDHIDYYARLVGPDHVGLGLDLVTGHERDDFSLLGYKPAMYQGVWKNGVQQTISGIESLADVPNITRGLVLRGYSDSDVSMILGGNFERVLSNIWGRRS